MRQWALALAAVLLTTQPVRPQTGAGSIQGTVRDAASAVIPGAKVTLLQEQTARQVETTTNQTGFYVFPSQQPGQ